MVKRRKQMVKAQSGAFDDKWLGYKLPVLFELKDCRQLAADHWQGRHPDGALFDIRGGAAGKAAPARLQQ